jgi:hypothetical protein
MLLLRQMMEQQLGSNPPPSALDEELARQERPTEWGEPRPVETQPGSLARLRTLPGTEAAQPTPKAKTPGGSFVEGMVKRGWTREEAAGLAGNVHIESAFRPDVKSSAPKEQSYGLMQWNKDRLQGLKNMAAATKRDWRDPEAQMDWINMERTGESVKYGGSNEKGFYKKALGQKGTPEEYAERIGRYVERPRRIEDTLKQRQQYAKQYYSDEGFEGFGGGRFGGSGSGRSFGEGSAQPVSYESAPVYEGQGFVFHHSGGDSLKDLETTLKKRKLGSQYLMDRDGTIYSFAGQGSPHIQPNDKWGGKAPGLSNANAIGMEIVAKDDTDLTPAQIESAKAFIAQRYPNMPVYGHGEVNPGHKQEREGMTVVEAIRAMRGQA